MSIGATVRGTGTGSTTAVETETGTDTNLKGVIVTGIQVGTTMAPRIKDEMIPPTMTGANTAALHTRSLQSCLACLAHSLTILSAYPRSALLQVETLDSSIQELPSLLLCSVLFLHACCRKRPAEELQQTEEEVKRQRLAKLAAWRQQQEPAVKAEPSVEAEPSSYSNAFQTFYDEEEPPQKQTSQQATWCGICRSPDSSFLLSMLMMICVTYRPHHNISGRQCTCTCN